MQHLGTIPLETERLTLRRFTMADAPAMFANWASDPEVTRYLRWEAYSNVGGCIGILENWTGHYPEDDFYLWAITLREKPDDPIGSIGTVQHSDLVQMVHIGYCLGRAWWRQGIMTEALAAMLAFFFEQVGANRVESQHDPRNPNSGRVMQACGMRQEGVLRQADWNNQGICDAALYAILREEYRGRT